MSFAGAQTSARVKVVLQFEDLGTWSSQTAAEEIFRKAAETVLQRLRAYFQDERGIQIVGEPVVELVVARGVP